MLLKAATINFYSLVNIGYLELYFVLWDYIREGLSSMLGKVLKSEGVLALKQWKVLTKPSLLEFKKRLSNAFKHTCEFEAVLYRARNWN